MSLVSALDSNGDWQFGQSLNNYKSNQDALAQNIQTRLSSWIGNCFFDLGAGIDWKNLLGSKDELGLNLAVAAVILNTDNVTSILQLILGLDPQRNCTISYSVYSTYSTTVSNIVQIAI